MSILDLLFPLLKENYPDTIALHDPGAKGEVSMFFHLTNVKSLTKNFRIGKHIEIRKAKPPEAKFISERLRETSYSFALAPVNPYESEKTHNYTVLSYKGKRDSKYLPNIAHTALAKKEIFSGLHFQVIRQSEEGFPGGVGASLKNTNENIVSDICNGKRDFLQLKKEDVDDIGYVLEKTRTFSHPTIDIISILNKYEEIDRISDSSPFKFLGYMSLIESIITHKPRPNDTYDSITKQVGTKMTLLNKRFKLKLDYSNFFDGSFDERKQIITIWGKIYTYRSSIAHGSLPDFEKELFILKNPLNALAFIRLSTRVLMRQCLEEPDLIADLKKC